MYVVEAIMKGNDYPCYFVDRVDTAGGKEYKFSNNWKKACQFDKPTAKLAKSVLWRRKGIEDVKMIPVADMYDIGEDIDKMVSL